MHQHNHAIQADSRDGFRATLDESLSFCRELQHIYHLVGRFGIEPEALQSLRDLSKHIHDVVIQQELHQKQLVNAHEQKSFIHQLETVIQSIKSRIQLFNDRHWGDECRE